MVLILNMAVCDIMIGVYAIVISNSNIYDMAANADWLTADTIKSFPYCRIASVLMTTGQYFYLLLRLAKGGCWGCGIKVFF